MNVTVTFDEINVKEVNDIGTVKILMLKGEKGDVGEPTDAQVQTAVNEWLDGHPEATTTVQDGSISIPKLANDVVSFINSKASAIEETASGNPATFNDGADGIPVKSLKVGIEPIQNLNGYDHPWVGGAGNNLIDKTAFNRTSTLVYIPMNVGDGDFTMSTDCPLTSGTPVRDIFILGGNVSEGADSGTNGVSSNTPRTVTAVDGYITIASRYNENRNDPLNYNWMLNKGDTALPYEPYSNICPITGHTSATVTRTGKNILNYNNLEQAALNVGIAVDETGLVYDSSPTGDNRGWNYNASNWKMTLPAGTYTLTVIVTETSESGSSAFRGYKSDGSLLFANINAYLFQNGGTAIRTFTLDEETDIGFECKCYAAKYFVMLETGDTATAYESYQGQTVTIDLNGTRYGGTLDVLTGVLTVDRAMRTVNGSENWAIENADASHKKYWITDSTIAKSSNYKASAYIICDKLPTAVNSYDYTTNYMAITGWASTASVNYLYIIVNTDNTDIADVTALKAWLTENPLTVVYKLATPQTVQLTAQQVTSLLGVNHISADCGDVDVVYRADTKLYIDSLTDPDSDMIADVNIESGKYFIINNQLYLSTTSIAQGETIVVGSNCQETNLADALNALI